MKNTIAVSRGDAIVLSQHLGDLETVEACGAFAQMCDTLPRLTTGTLTAVACDWHPDYYSTRQAEAYGLPLTRVQHHYAHALACMAEHGLEAPLLGMVWDGTGYGLDGTLWGGEFLRITDTAFQRAARLRPFPLPGGAAAIREPWRTALGLMFQTVGDDVFAMADLEPVRACSAVERRIVRTLLQRNVRTPLTSSVGRLFDAVASLVGLRQRVTFEGQAAMELEYAAQGQKMDAVYPFDIGIDNGALSIDWAPLVQAILADYRRHTDIARIAAAFHNTLAEIAVETARRLGEERIVLSGGCFQNRYLTECTVARLRAAGFRPYWHCLIPPNDGGIALGQIAAVLRAPQVRQEETAPCA